MEHPGLDVPGSPSISSLSLRYIRTGLLRMQCFPMLRVADETASRLHHTTWDQLTATASQLHPRTEFSRPGIQILGRGIFKNIVSRRALERHENEKLESVNGDSFFFNDVIRNYVKPASTSITKSSRTTPSGT
jgi:hypothetical protein